MVKVLICPDSLTESLTAINVAEAIAEGVKTGLSVSAQTSKDHDLIVLPASDGGAGFIDCMELALTTIGRECRKIQVQTVDALRRPILANILLCDQSAYIESAQVIGLSTITPDERDPSMVTSIGLGDCILAAMHEDVHDIIIGLGDTATNDIGAGMAHVLGTRFLDEDGIPLDPIPEQLENLESIDISELHVRLGETKFTAVCNASVPLIGKHGTAAVCGPQKGANRHQVRTLDHIARDLSKALADSFYKLSDEDPEAFNMLGLSANIESLTDVPGAGAAGGLGYMMMALLGAQFKSGVELLNQAVNLENIMSEADYILTSDRATKVPSSYTKIATQLTELSAILGKSVVIFSNSEAELSQAAQIWAQDTLS